MLSFEPSIHAAVIVAPMPCCSGCSSADLKMLLFAKQTALASRLVLALKSGCALPKNGAAGFFSASMQCLTRVSTARALATSPCASPPMPSESTKRFSGVTMRKQSSLLVRTRPTSLTPPLTIRTLAPLPLAEYTPPAPLPRSPLPTLTEPQHRRKSLNPTNYSLIRHIRTTSQASPLISGCYAKALHALRASMARFRYTLGSRGAPRRSGPIPVIYECRQETAHTASREHSAQRHPGHARVGRAESYWNRTFRNARCGSASRPHPQKSPRDCRSGCRLTLSCGEGFGAGKPRVARAAAALQVDPKRQRAISIQRAHAPADGRIHRRILRFAWRSG